MKGEIQNGYNKRRFDRKAIWQPDRDWPGTRRSVPQDRHRSSAVDLQVRLRGYEIKQRKVLACGNKSCAYTKAYLRNRPISTPQSSSRASKTGAQKAGRFDISLAETRTRIPNVMRLEVEGPIRADRLIDRLRHLAGLGEPQK